MQSQSKKAFSIDSIRKRIIGHILVEEGLITENQLNEAAEYQKTFPQDKRPLIGPCLVKLGFCKEEDIALALAKKSGLNFISLKEFEIERNALDTLTVEQAEKFECVPIGFDEQNKLVIIVDRIFDNISWRDVQGVTGFQVVPVVTTLSDYDFAWGVFRDAKSMQITVPPTEHTTDEKALDYDSDEDLEQVVSIVTQLLLNAIRRNVSDIHIEPMEKRLRIRFRIDGVIHEVMSLPSSMISQLTTRIKVIANMDIAEKRIPQDARFTYKADSKSVDFRVASLPTAFGEKITMRLLTDGDTVITLAMLGLLPAHQELYNKLITIPYGFILITGPTGSGKSTTLYASLDQVNSENKNIITLEDPIEKRMTDINQIQINAKVGLTFPSGLRSILRSDPDIIMVGEIRDGETAKIAIESAMTGHLVFSTLHTNDAAGALSRLVDMGIEPFLVASSLSGVVGQRLFRKLCEKCKKKVTYTREEILLMCPSFSIGEDELELDLYEPVGCTACNKTGYKGRMGVYEILKMTEDLGKMVLKRAISSEIKMEAIKNGMITMQDDGFQKVRKGITSLAELLRVVV